MDSKSFYRDHLLEYFNVNKSINIRVIHEVDAFFLGRGQWSAITCTGFF